MPFLERVFAASTCAAFVAACALPASASPRRDVVVTGGGGGPAFIPTGQYITATIAQGASYQRLVTGLRADGNADADSAMTSALSPDGSKLLVLTSGFNVTINYPNGNPILFPVLDPTTGLAAPFTNRSTGQTNQTGYNQSEFLFVFDVTSRKPVKIQQIYIPDTYSGLAWKPDGSGFYVSGGIDDRVLVYKSSTTGFVPDAPFIILGHNDADTAPLPIYDGGILKTTPAGAAIPALATGAIVSGLDVSRDGKTLVAANFENASASIVDTTARKVTKEVRFFVPGGGTGHGEFPYGVAVVSHPDGSFQKAYVSSQRDDEVDVIHLGQFTTAIKVPAGPNKMALSADQRRLYVACGNADAIAVIDTFTDKLIRTISLSRSGDPYLGSSPNSVAIGGGGSTLYVTLGNENAVAVVDLTRNAVIGRFPTGWMPTSVALSSDGQYTYVVNEKSNEGPDPGQTYYSWNTPYGISLNTTAQNNYTWESEKSGLLSLPTPQTSDLGYLSEIVDANDGFDNHGVVDPMMGYLQGKIKHVIYIVNENRTFDQVLGDIGNGANGDPRLTFFTQPITPNLHALAKDYVTLDNFYDASETSGVGWNWVMQGHTNDFIEKTQPVQYGNSNGLGLTYDWQGIVANMNLGLPASGGNSIFTTRITGIIDSTGRSTILPGFKDPSASVGADDLSANALGGYVWESALRAGKTIRNYGWQCDLTYYGTGTPFDPPLVRNPYPKALQSSPSTPSIAAATDRYYRAFDQRYPDIFRIEEWKREFAGFVQNRNLPNLEVMTIPHDHTGSFGTAIEGLGTPQLELADHDYAIGELVDAVTHSPYWSSTAIVMLEDDPQDGQDHVEAHRSIIHVISPYTKAHSLDHTGYTTLNALRTVEDLLGIHHLGILDDNATAMTDVFSKSPNLQPYTAIIPGSLCAKPVSQDLVPACFGPAIHRTRMVAQTHDSAWWANATRGLDFREPDHVPAHYYNQILEAGIAGDVPLPSGAAPKVTGDDD